MKCPYCDKGDMFYQEHNKYGYVFICSSCVGALEFNPEESKPIYKRIDKKIVDILCPFCKAKMKLLELFFHTRDKDIPNGDMLYQCKCGRYAIARKKDIFWCKGVELTTPKEKEKTYNYSVYIIRCETTPYCKIGMTGNLFERMKALQVAIPMTLKLECAIKCENRNSAHRMEKQIHEHLKDCRKNGEWFKLNEIKERKKTCLSL